MQVAALWTLRNFAVVELYRTRISTMAVVMSLCVTMLEDNHQPPAVHHAAAAVLQVYNHDQAESSSLTKVLTNYSCAGGNNS